MVDPGASNPVGCFALRPIQPTLANQGRHQPCSPINDIHHSGDRLFRGITHLLANEIASGQSETRIVDFDGHFRSASDRHCTYGLHCRHLLLWGGLCLGLLLIDTQIKKRARPRFLGAGHIPGDDLLSQDLSSHYHRRCSVSLPGSEWDRVVPTRSGHQRAALIEKGRYSGDRRF